MSTDRRFALLNKPLSAGQISAISITESQITDGSILARVADNETITGEWTFTADGAGVTAAIELTSASPWIMFRETDQSDDEEVWNFGVNSKLFRLFTSTAAATGTAAATPIQVTRGTGTAIDEIEFNATDLDFNGLLDVSGRATFNGAVSGTSAGINISGTLPALHYNETDAATDEKFWRVLTSGGDFFIQTLNDAGDTAVTAIRGFRTGTVVDEIEFNGTLFDFNGAADFSGDINVAGNVIFPTIKGIRGEASSGDVNLDITSDPNDGTGDAFVRVNRSTNTTGAVQVTFYDGDNTTGNHFQIGKTSTWTGARILGTGSLFISEKADALADVAAYGQLWVKTETPNMPYFTDDAGKSTMLLPHIYADISSDTDISEVTDVTIATIDIPNVAVGDILEIDAWFHVVNTSGAARVYVITVDFDAVFDVEFTTGSLAVTTGHPFHIQGVMAVHSAALATAIMECDGQLIAGLASGTDTTMAATHLRAMGWGTSATDRTGTQTCALKIRSADATAGQVATVSKFVVKRVAAT